MVTSITVQVELMMYGFAGLNICTAKDGVIVSWIAVADGGEMLANDSIKIAGKDFENLHSLLDGIELPALEGNEMSRAWDIQFFDEKDNEVKSIDRGYWPVELLNRIMEIIDSFLENDMATEWIHNIIEA